MKTVVIVVLCCAGAAALAWGLAQIPEPACRSICVKDHMELRSYMRPSYSGNGQMEVDTMPVSVCDEHRDVCRADAGEERER